MSRLTRFTTSYDPREDRLRLTSESGDGEVMSCLLTRRLMTRLLEKLIVLLQPATTDSKTASARTTEIRNEMKQQAAQEKARAGIKAQPPVRSESKDSPWLVDAIDLKVKKGQVHLTIRGVDDEQIATALSGQELRQWLIIVHGLWEKAAWGGELWPEWMQEENAAAQSNEVVH